MQHLIKTNPKLTLLRQFPELSDKFSHCFSLALHPIVKGETLHYYRRWWAVVNLNQINKLLETLVGWLVWNDQVMNESVRFCSTRTEENSMLLGSCINAVGSKAFLEALCVEHPVLATLNKWPDCFVCHHFALQLRRHFVVSAPRPYGHLHAFKQRYKNTISNRANPHSTTTALDTRFRLRMRTIHVGLT